MKKKLIILVLFLLTFGHINSQTYMQQNFEGAKIPDNWSQQFIQQTEPWKCKTGVGANPVPPTTAYEGLYNASFYKTTISTAITKLITHQFDLEDAVKPELHFQYAQYFFEDDFGSGNAKISVYYRSIPDGIGWTKIKDFDDPTTGWNEGVVLIPDTAHFGTIQLAFEGRIEDDNQHGVCIDDIKVIETGVIPKFLKSVLATQASEDLIPTGSINNPILSIRFTVGGNDGQLNLNSLVVNALLQSTEVVPANGVKLFATVSSRFNDTLPLTTAKSFIDGKAVFNNLNHPLPIGDSYIWVSYDVPVDNSHIFKGKNVDASILANDIIVQGTPYPETINPVGKRSISESLFYDDFEGLTQWNFTGQFQHDKPKGKGGTYGKADPTSARGGYKVMGVDLTGLPTFLGDYEKNLPSNAYTAVMDTVVSAKYYTNLNLEFYRWLNVYFTDSARIDMSLDGGETYQNLYTNVGTVSENQWTFKDDLPIGDKANREDSIKFRFTLGPTGNLYPYSGWNIDNFAITGNFVENDAGIISVIAPVEGCGHLTPESVIVTVKNFGFSPLTNNIPIGFSVNGGTSWTMDTIKTTIPKEGTLEYTFVPLIDITAPGPHNILVKTFLPNDEDTVNNKTNKTLFNFTQPNLPYFENFEANDGYWKKGGVNETWEYGKPTGIKINKAYSGLKCWATNLDGNYTNNDSAWLESPCFDFTGINKPIIDLMVWANAEINKDGLAIYYKLNNDVNWELVPTEGSYPLWKWYNNPNIEALNHEGWDSVTNKWFNARQILPADVANEALVKFRFVFKSNESNTGEGFAIDDIRIYDAPIDAGITAIVNPTNECSLSKTQAITVTLKNYGIRPITLTDSLFTKVLINNTTTLTDTFFAATPIAINESANFTFTQTVDMFAKKWHKMVAYTHAKGDTAYYIAGVYNDTIVDSVYVKGEPYYTLGPDIGTFEPDSIILNGGQHSVGGANFIEYNWIYVDRPDSTLTIVDQRTFEVPTFPDLVDLMKFSITVKNDSACFMQDTIQILKSETDIGILSFTGIDDKCINNQNQALNVIVKNFSSTYTIPTGTEILVGYKLDLGANEDSYIESFNLTSDLIPESTTSHLFVIQPTYNFAGNFTLDVFTAVNADLNYSNDTLYQVVEIYPLPEVDLGIDSILTLTANGTILDAGLTNPPSTYLWHDNSTMQTFTIPDNLTNSYSVTVTDAQVCGTSTDTKLVISDNWVLNSLINPISECSASATEQITIELINNGPNTYNAGYQIPTQITFNTSVINTNIVLTSTLLPLDSINYTFAQQFDMTMAKDYTINVKINPTHDYNRLDNELEETISIWGIFPVDLGSDIISKRADTVILYPGDYYDTYLWSDGSTNPTFIIPVKNSDTYSVAVTSAEGCSNSSDMVEVFSNDLAILEIITPQSRCELTGTNRISLMVANYGTDDIPISEEFKFYYRFNGGAWVEKIYTTSSIIPSGESDNIILYENIVFDSNISYEMELYVEWEKDYFPQNDTVTKNIYQYSSPVVNLGTDIYTTLADTLVLDAGANTTYLWQDGNITQFYDVIKNYTKNYSVIVTNSNGCFGYDTIKIFTNDLTISSIENMNRCAPSSSNTVTINLKLNSQDTLNVGEQIYSTFNFAGNIVNETFVLTNTLTSAATLPFTFATPFTLTDTGNFSVTCSATINNEAAPNNDTLVKYFRIGAFPVKLGADIKTYNNTAILDAGVGFTNYLWSDASTNRMLTVSSSGNYKVTATDINTCLAYDTINVLFLKPLYEIVEIVSLSNNCSHSATETISFTLKNSGNDTVSAASTIPVSYRINNGTPVTEYYTFTSNFLPGDTVTIEFDSIADLSEPGIHTILITATLSSVTSSKDTSINTWGYPSVSLGNNIETPNDEEVLNAGADFATYLWSTAATTQTITVSSNGDYWVEVSNSNGCKNRDTVNVFFVPTSLYISEFVRPLTACETLTNEEVTIKVKNGSTKTVPAGTLVILGYQLDGQNRVNENNTLENGMPSNITLEYTFTNKLNSPTSGNKNIQFYVRIDEKDIDTAEYEISVYEEPVFFGGDDSISVSSYPYELDAEVDAESYLWNSNDTTPTLTVNADGTYWVKIIDDNACEFTDTVYVDRITGIHDSWSKQIEVYPNPGESEISVNLPKNIGKVTLQITDLGGKLIFVKKDVSENLKLDISKWKVGVYILRITNGEQFGVYRIVKQ